MPTFSDQKPEDSVIYIIIMYTYIIKFKNKSIGIGHTPSVNVEKHDIKDESLKIALIWLRFSHFFVPKVKKTLFYIKKNSKNLHESQK